LNKESLHTFVILAYKESSYIQECISALKKQSVASRIVVATSTPSEFLKELSNKEKLELVVNPASGNIASDWSFGYALAKTKYVTLAHQDDIYNEDYTKECVSKMDRFKNSLIGFSNYSELICSKVVNNNLNLVVKKILLNVFYVFGYINSNVFKKKSLVFGSPICCPSVVFNKNNIGDFEFDKNIGCALDWDAWLRLAQRKGDFVYIRKTLMQHRIHPIAQSALYIQNGKRAAEELEIFRKIWPKPLAVLVSKLYSLSHKLYRIGGMCGKQ